MLYTKNIPDWERILRMLMGLAGLAFAIVSFGESTLGLVIGLGAAMMAMTGLFGFCPMCAMAGGYPE